MSFFSAPFSSRRAQDLRASFRHAFAVRQEQQDFTTADLALLDRVAQAIVTRGMSTPATLFLESMGPMNFLGSQALHFLSPIIECALSVTELAQIARLLERRDSIARLVALIEAQSAPSQGAPAR
ncbi:MAG: hypothetical protein ABI856_05540 [Nitrospira sp.]